MVKPVKPLTLAEKAIINRRGEIERKILAVEDWKPRKPVVLVMNKDAALAVKVLSEQYPEDHFYFSGFTLKDFQGVYIGAPHKAWPWEKRKSGPMWHKARARERAEIQEIVDDIGSGEEAGALDGNHIVETTLELDPEVVIACLEKKYPGDTFFEHRTGSSYSFYLRVKVN